MPPPCPYAWVHLHFHLPQLTASQGSQTQKYSNEKTRTSSLNQFLFQCDFCDLFAPCPIGRRCLLSTILVSLMPTRFLLPLTSLVSEQGSGQHMKDKWPYIHVGSLNVERGSALLIGGWRLRFNNSAPHAKDQNGSRLLENKCFLWNWCVFWLRRQLSVEHLKWGLVCFPCQTK